MTALDALLAPERLVDLTQPLGPDTVLWPGSTPFTARVDADYDTHGGYSRELAVPEHAGTHVDAPAHFHRGGDTADLLRLPVLVRPAVKLDVRRHVGQDATFALDAPTLEELEAREGRIPAGCAVLVHTGWERRRDDPIAYAGGDSLRFPGLAPDAAGLLVARGVVGVGIDTLGIDPGHVEGFPAHRVTLSAGLWHVEGLVNLEAVPPRGAWIVVGVVPVVAGSGAPARVFAVLPPGA